MAKITEEMAKEAEGDQCGHFTGILNAGTIGAHTQETHICPECKYPFTFNLYGGSMITSGSFAEVVAVDGYCPHCLVKTLCEKFGVKLEKQDE